MFAKYLLVLSLTVWGCNLVRSLHFKNTELYLLRIFHQNDIHTHFSSVDPSTKVCSSTERSSRRCVGGFARALTFIKKQKELSESLNLYAGDFFGGHILYTLFGADLASDLVPLMPYNAVAFGHAEFSHGIEKLHPFAMKVGKKFICTNIFWQEQSDENKNNTVNDFIALCPKSRIFTIGPQLGGRQIKKKVGVMGFTTPDTALMAPTEEVVFLDEIKALNEEAKKLRKEVDIIIAVGHSGLRRDKEIASRVDELDILVGGHSHTLMADGQWQPFVPLPPRGTDDQPDSLYPTVVTQDSGRKVLILHAYKHGKYMGFMDVGFDAKGEVHDWWPDLRLLDHKYKEHPDVLHILHKYDNKLKEMLPQVIGEAMVDLVGGPELCNVVECNMANLVADAVVRANKKHESYGAKAVYIALVTAEVIRMPKPKPAGPITLKFITQAVPYGHTFSVLHVSGSTLWDALESSASSRNQSNGRFLQVSGLKVTINEAMPPGKRLKFVSVLVPCRSCDSPELQPLDLTATYTIAVPDYIADGGAGYTMLNRNDDSLKISSLDKHMLDQGILVEYLKQMTPVQPELEDRIVIVSEKPFLSAAGRLVAPQLLFVIVVFTDLWLYHFMYLENSIQCLGCIV